MDFDDTGFNETGELAFSLNSTESSEILDFQFDAEEDIFSNISNDHCPQQTTKTANDVPWQPFEVYLQMQEFMYQIVELLFVSNTTARLLLKHYDWDKDKLIIDFIEGREKCFKDANVLDNLNLTTNNGKPDENVCEICYTEGDLISLIECHHAFCRDCWAGHLCTQIKDSIGIDIIYCPGHDCKVVVDDDKVLELVPASETELVEKYYKLVIEPYMKQKKEFAMCPGLDCQLIYKINPTKTESVLCKMNHQFCSSCNKLWHEPIPCILLERWLERKSKDELENANWLMEFTKPCPNSGCGMNILKNEGCNHMTCYKCKHEFCWICSEPTKRDHNCNRFPQNTIYGEERRFESPERFEHFQIRYQNHIKSLMLEQKLFDNADKKMKEMQETLSVDYTITPNQVRFYKNAIIDLSRSREVLSATYVFAYFAKQGHELSMFEHNQEDLERATEALSGYLEKKITDDNYEDLKVKLQDKAKYCNKRKQVLLDHVHEGMLKNWWNLEQHTKGKNIFKINTASI